MKILFVTGHPYLPQLFGGLQTSTDQLCRKLTEKGHGVTVLAGLTPEGWLGWKSRIKMQINKNFTGHKVSKDTGLGYPVWRTWAPWEAIEYVCKKEKPNLIIVTSGNIVRTALAAKSTKIPILAQLHDVQFHLHGGDFRDLGGISCIANSRFTAEKYRQMYGIDPIIIYPFVQIEQYKTETTRENITFINPHYEKGQQVALEIARLCPDIPFSFVEAWPLPLPQRDKLMQKLSELPNVTLRMPEKDMRKVYGKCKILLAPSIAEEAYGRIATEAQISGIPVIASARGGLPEAVGPGGILLDPDGPIDDWVKAVRKLWHDDEYYADVSAQAHTYSQRPEISYSHQIEAYEKAFLAAYEQQKKAV